MNNQDEEAFLKWLVTKLIEEDQEYIKKGELSPYFKPSYKNGKPDLDEAWQAALEYERFNHKYCVVGSLDKLCEKLEAENKKLKDALKNCLIMSPLDPFERGDMIREALKEVGEA